MKSNFNIILERLIECPFSISNDPEESDSGSYQFGDGFSYRDELGSRIFNKWYNYLIRGVLDKNNNEIVSIEKTREELSTLFARYSESILYCSYENEQSTRQLLIASKIINGRVFDNDFCEKFNEKVFFNPLNHIQRIINIFEEVKNEDYFWKEDCLMKESFCNTFSQLALEYKIIDTIIEISASQNPDVLKYASEALMSNREFILAFVKQDGSALKYATKDLKADKEIVFQAVKQDGSAFKYADKDLKTDKEFVLEAIIQDGSAFKYADKDLKTDKEFILEVVEKNSSNGCALRYIYKDLKADKEIVFQAVKQNGLAIKYAHKDLKSNAKVVLEAVKQNGLALQFTHKDLKSNTKVVLEAVKQNGLALQFAHRDLKTDKEIVLEAVKNKDQDQNKENALQFTSGDLKVDKEVLSATIISPYYDVQHVAEELLLEHINQFSAAEKRRIRNLRGVKYDLDWT